MLVCEDGDQLVLDDDGVRKAPGRCRPATSTSTASGIGDVGHGVLRDRRVLAEEGVVVVDRRPSTLKTGAIITGPEVITRGWVTPPRPRTCSTSAATRWPRRSRRRSPRRPVGPDIESLQKVVRRATGRFVNDRTRRRPMIVPVVMEA